MKTAVTDPLACRECSGLGLIASRDPADPGYACGSCFDGVVRCQDCGARPACAIGPDGSALCAGCSEAERAVA